MYNPADKRTNRQTSPSTSYRESIQSCRLGVNVLFNWFTACTTFPNHTQTCKSRCELYVYIEPGGVRVGLEVVSRYFSLSATSLTATTHSSLLFNYLLLIRDEGVQAWVKRYKTPRNRAENLLLWKPSPHFISFFPLLLLFAPGTGKITTDPVYSLVQWWKICCH